jgi:carboxyl-terminal processing protease
MLGLVAQVSPMTVFSRLSVVWLLITLMAPLLKAEEASDAPDNSHHSNTEARQSLPLEELQMFADVFNQIRQGYVESVPDSELFELAVQGMLSGTRSPFHFFKRESLRLLTRNNTR